MDDADASTPDASTPDAGTASGDAGGPEPAVVPVEGGIRLGQLLKLASLVDTGADAKEALAAGVVRVNGEVEVRRGRQLASGDVVAVDVPDAVHLEQHAPPVVQLPQDVEVAAPAARVEPHHLLLRHG
ncbi:RNA-binding S4 domain-containing protein, partial [Pseudokineococcus marinus]|uniref:RNA-binding S4 domain-containing protein n=1 Tax=Pseudokineococcus marinus TaxID=351215 RepID=UPI003908AD01